MNSFRTVAPQGPQSADVHQPHRDHENDCSQHADGEEPQWSGQKQQHHSDGGRSGQVRELAAAAGGFHHRGLGRASINDEGAAQSRRGIGRAEPEEIAVLVQRLVMAHGVGPRRYGALCDDHHKAGAGNREQGTHLVPGRRWKTQPRQPAHNRAQDGNAVTFKIKGGTQPKCRGHGHERARQSRRQPTRANDGRYDRSREGQGGPVCCRQMLYHRQELPHCGPAVHLDPRHFAEDGNAHLEADSSEEADQNRAGEEIRQEP